MVRLCSGGTSIPRRRRAPTLGEEVLTYDCLKIFQKELHEIEKSLDRRGEGYAWDGPSLKPPMRLCMMAEIELTVASIGGVKWPNAFLTLPFKSVNICLTLRDYTSNFIHQYCRHKNLLDETKAEFIYCWLTCVSSVERIFF